MPVFLTRAYKLALHPNVVKSDTARYTYERHLQYVNAWVGPLFFNGNKPRSTAGLGQLANQAQHKAQGIIRALKAAQAETGDKANVPQVKRVGCPAKILSSKDSSFDYWLRVPNQFSKKDGVFLPAKSHAVLNKKLREGWALNPTAELIKDKNGKLYALVFVQREVSKALPKLDCLGVDVGYRHGACRSDGHIGTNTGRVIKRVREIKAQRQRQGLKVSGVKSRIKQLLDREARKAVDVARRTSRSLAVESPKQIANLRSGSLHGWARCYFARRCEILCEEKEVWLVWVNPSYSSQTCAECSHKDALSRNKCSFVCTACGHNAHSDVNAARVLASKGAVSVENYLSAIRNRERRKRA